ncbi:putative isomerase YbhE [Amniculicola lignicola CBS 123094]|uniref:Putative isomerase YbhE n=1 Tax=Amniculicola lignicola CBS 123094 TaxID=1392246 RepID=A0A6A5X3N4_9PLEO|nr:putative isomerase YbhE [Amniculicola lignicola CBS 123094]
MHTSTLALAILAGTATAANVKLFITSYAGEGSTLGKVTTLELKPGLVSLRVPSADLMSTRVNEQCGSAPTWLDLTDKKFVFCVDEGFQTPNASINTLEKNADGSLKSVGKVDTIQGPVSTQFYNKNAAVALAHYGGSAISTFTQKNGVFTPLQNFTFVAKGPNPAQEAAHVHHSVIDPTGNYIIFPDLGADKVYVYCIDPKTSLLKEHPALATFPAGSGPRHAAFWKSGGDTYLFVVTELTNKIYSFKVSYTKDVGLTFVQADEQPLFPAPAPQFARAAEVKISPDNRFVVASNRNATLLSAPNPDPKNSTAVASDTLVTFAPQKDGKLKFVQLAPSGGSFPRHFSFSKDGSMIASANQRSGSVFVWSRDVKSGKIGDKIAAIAGIGEVTNVVWDE